MAHRDPDSFIEVEDFADEPERGALGSAEPGMEAQDIAEDGVHVGIDKGLQELGLAAVQPEPMCTGRFRSPPILGRLGD